LLGDVLKEFTNPTINELLEDKLIERPPGSREGQGKNASCLLKKGNTGGPWFLRANQNQAFYSLAKQSQIQRLFLKKVKVHPSIHPSIHPTIFHSVFFEGENVHEAEDSPRLKKFMICLHN